MKHIILFFLMATSTIFVQSQIVIPLILPNNCTLSTGIDKIQEETSMLKIYPNPTDGNFSLTIETASMTGKINIEIYNEAGTECYSIQAYNNFNVMIRQIDVTHLPNGIYFLKVVSQNSVLNSSFIIQK